MKFFLLVFCTAILCSCSSENQSQNDVSQPVTDAKTMVENTNKEANANGEENLATVSVAEPEKNNIVDVKKETIENATKESTADEIKVGEWTQDWDGACKLAKNNGLPIFVNFTGSDWCGWCKLMDKNVFSQKEWKDWVADRLVLVYIDFPMDKRKVPEKWVTRNNQLQIQFGVEGYPTYFLLDSNGRQLALFGASRTATAASFIKQVEAKMPSNGEQK